MSAKASHRLPPLSGIVGGLPPACKRMPAWQGNQRLLAFPVDILLRTAVARTTGAQRSMQSPATRGRTRTRPMLKLPSHTRYSYSPIVNRTNYSWPEGKRLAFYIALNIEHFAFGTG